MTAKRGPEETRGGGTTAEWHVARGGEGNLPPEPDDAYPPDAEPLPPPQDDAGEPGPGEQPQ